MTASRARIAIQLAVRNRDYPRNHRIRTVLGQNGFRVHTVPITGKSYFERCVRLFMNAWMIGPADVYILSELGIQYAWVGRLLSTLRRATYWVDWFVGMYETNILDWGERPVGSPTAKAYMISDRLAARMADILTTDTGVRAEMLEAEYGAVGPVFVLPVGAPDWASTTQSTVPRDGPFQLLFYGNYLPLHGLPVILHAVARVSVARPIQATFVGDGKLRESAENMAEALGISSICSFFASVPQEELPDWIARSDAVLGVFGESEKARSVIANKVWQGLACGRPVVTRSSPALDEIKFIVGPMLRTVEVGAGDPSRKLADALEDLIDDLPFPHSDLAKDLEAYVKEQYDYLVDRLNHLVTTSGRL